MLSFHSTSVFLSRFFIFPWMILVLIIYGWMWRTLSYFIWLILGEG